MAGKKKVPAKKGSSNLPTSTKAEMDAAIAALGDRIGGAGGDKISVKGKRFTFPDGHQEEAPFGFIIVNWVTAHHYWLEDYDEKNPTPPDCWAYGTNPKTMSPSQASVEIQSEESCNDCPQNVFGSGVGNAKACKNMRVLGLVAGDSDDPEDPILKMEVSPTGLRVFDAYVQTLAAKGFLPVQVITEISFDENQTYPSLRFKAVGPNPNVELHWSRRTEAEELLLVEPDPSSFASREVAAPKGRRASKKTTSRKAGGRSAGSRRV